jgi:hypothetical protein
MDEYLKLLILAYFKNHIGEYSFEELRKSVGVSGLQFGEIMDEVFVERLLKYEDAKIFLTFKGRMLLMNSSMEEYHEVDDIEEVLFREKWPIDKPFIVHGFSKKKWRDS